MSWSPRLAVVLGGLCLMMQRIQREMLRLEKLPMLMVPWLGSSVGQRELCICT